MHVLDHRHLVARARRRAELELDDVALLRQLDLLDLVQRLDAALHLRRLGGVRLEALDEALLLGEHRLLPRERGLLVVLADGALALVEIVIAGVDDDLAAIDLRDLGHDAVHEFAVVRRHQQRAGVRLEEVLQPDDRFDVEVIGRLVHQQHVGPAEQHARQRDAHFPAAGERPHVAIDLVVVESEPVQHLARLRLESVAAEVLVLLLHLAETRQNAVHLISAVGILHGVMQFFELVVQVARAAAAGDRLVEHRPPRHLLHVLAEVADGQPLGDGDIALVGILFADDHAEQRRFARPVRSDEPHLFAGIQLKRRIHEDKLPAVLLIDVGKRNHRL